MIWGHNSSCEYFLALTPLITTDGCAWMCSGGGNLQNANVRVVVLGFALSGCALQRAEIAQDARVQMVGMSKEQVLACMGAPATKAAEGTTEVWGFNSGNGMTVVDASYGRYGGSAVASSRLPRHGGCSGGPGSRSARHGRRRRAFRRR